MRSCCLQRQWRLPGHCKLWYQRLYVAWQSEVQKTGNVIGIIGCVIELAGMGGIYIAYTQVAQTTKPGKVEPIFPSGLWLILIITVLILVVSILQMFCSRS